MIQEVRQKAHTFHCLHFLMDCWIPEESVYTCNSFGFVALPSALPVPWLVTWSRHWLENSSSSMNLPIILSNRRNSKYSVILLYTQIPVISSWISKFFPGSKGAYIMYFIFIERLCQFLPAPKQSRKQKEHEKVEGDIWREPLSSKGLWQPKPSEPLE